MSVFAAKIEPAGSIAIPSPVTTPRAAIILVDFVIFSFFVVILLFLLFLYMT
jgi:hypothetical protein